MWLHFPDGCVLYEDFPDQPELPEPPVPPQSRSEMMLNNLAPSLLGGLGDLGPVKFHDSFSLRKTNSYEVKDNFARIKHGHTESIRSLTLTFPSFDTARSFKVEFRITAANLPDPAVGFLNVKVTK